MRFRRWIWLLFLTMISCSHCAVECSAQLVPAGSFRGRTLNEWGRSFVEWGIATGAGGQSLPNTLDGVRFLPPNFGSGDSVQNLTVALGTPLYLSPYFVVGEAYDNGTADDPADPIIPTLFTQTSIKTTYDGNMVFDGIVSSFADRKVDPYIFATPITYVPPQPRGGVNAISATFHAGGMAAIFDNLSLGDHTIRNEVDSQFFGKSSYTYHIKVVPEPSSMILGLGGLFLALRPVLLRRRARRRR